MYINEKPSDFVYEPRNALHNGTYTEALSVRPPRNDFP